MKNAFNILKEVKKKVSSEVCNAEKQIEILYLTKLVECQVMETEIALLLFLLCFPVWEANYHCKIGLVRLLVRLENNVPVPVPAPGSPNSFEAHFSKTWFFPIAKILRSVAACGSWWAMLFGIPACYRLARYMLCCRLVAIESLGRHSMPLCVIAIYFRIILIYVALNIVDLLSERPFCPSHYERERGKVALFPTGERHGEE